MNDDYNRTGGPASGEMTMRDYFAAQAMPAIYAEPSTSGYFHIAKLAYQMADAMLEARKL